MKLGSIVGLLILVAALGYVALHIQKNGVAVPTNEDKPPAVSQADNGMQAASEDLYKKQNEFRTWTVNHPEKPSAGYAKMSPSEQR